MTGRVSPAEAGIPHTDATGRQCGVGRDQQAMLLDSAGVNSNALPRDGSATAEVQVSALDTRGTGIVPSWSQLPLAIEGPELALEALRKQRAVSVERFLFATDLDPGWPLQPEIAARLETLPFLLHGTADAVSSEVVVRLRSVAQPVAHVAILYADRRPDVAMVSRWLGTSPRSLQRQFAAEGIPSPKRLVRLCRWLVFTGLPPVCWRSSTLMASVCGYATVTAFRKAVMRELGMSLRATRRLSRTYQLLHEEVVRSFGSHP